MWGKFTPKEVQTRGTGHGWSGEKRMKKRNALIALGVCAGFVLAACGGSESGSRTKNAALAKPPVAATGDCKDGQMVEGEDDDNCTLVVKVGNSSRKVVLETLNSDGGWDTVDSVIAKKGVAKFELAATDEDGIWLDGDYAFRAHAPKSGKNGDVFSAEFDVTFTSSAAADDTASADDGTDSGSSPEMQSAMNDIDNPTTKFDDNCSKIFNRIDCGYMFRPGKGPDFQTLGKDKWVKMCSTLLNRPAADCEKEFQFATSGGAKPNGMPGQGGGSMQGQPLDPAKVSAACAAIGMAEADCRAALQAGPMVALQKFGSKAEDFCKAYGGTSCADLIAKMAPTGGGSMQQPGMAGGNTQQPGMPGGNTQQPGTAGGSTQQPQQNTGGNGPSNDKVKAACATAGITDADCSKLTAANTQGSTAKPRDIIMSWGADKAEKFCQAIAQKPCAEVLK